MSQKKNGWYHVRCKVKVIISLWCSTPVKHQPPPPGSYKPIYFVIFQHYVLQPVLVQLAHLTGQAEYHPHTNGGWSFHPVPKAIQAHCSGCITAGTSGKMVFTWSLRSPHLVPSPAPPVPLCSDSGSPHLPTCLLSAVTSSCHFLSHCMTQVRVALHRGVCLDRVFCRLRGKAISI